MKLILERLVPAAPDWMVCIGCGYPVTELSFEPVLAWLIQVRRGNNDNGDEYKPIICVYPITVEGDVEHHAVAQVLRRPDGSLVYPGIQDFESEADVIAYYNNAARL